MTPALVRGRGFLLPNPPACEPVPRGFAGWDIPCEVKHRCAGHPPAPCVMGRRAASRRGLSGRVVGRWLRTLGNTKQSRWVCHFPTIVPGNAAGSVLCRDARVSVQARGRTQDQSQGHHSRRHVLLPELLPAAGTGRPWKRAAVLGTRRRGMSPWHGEPARRGSRAAPTQS